MLSNCHFRQTYECMQTSLPEGGYTIADPPSNSLNLGLKSHIAKWPANNCV